MLYFLVATIALLIGLFVGFLIGHWHGAFEVEDLVEDIDELEEQLKAASSRNTMLARLLWHKKNRRIGSNGKEKRAKRTVPVWLKTRRKMTLGS